MMGLKEREFAPVAAVSLEVLVPQDHFYRHLQKVLDLSLESLTTRFAVEAREAFQTHLQPLFQEEVEKHPSEPDPSPLDAAPQPPLLPTALSEEEQETLLAQQASRQDWYAKGGEQQREVRGLYQ